MTPPIELQDIEISHRIGRIINGGESSDPPPPRPIIARFASRRIKGAAMRQKKKLRRRRAPERDADIEPGNDEANADDTDGEENEDESSDDVRRMFPNPVYISDDLIRRRARLAKMAHKLRCQGRITDTWVFDGRITVKDQKMLFMWSRESLIFLTNVLCITW